MSSAALTSWRTDRAARLDRLVAAHAAVGGAGPGRRWVTEELNHALILRLASEFQGFARQLHNLCVSAVVEQLAPGSPHLQDAVRIPYLFHRRLDKGNAEPIGLRQDFSLFGMELWAEIDTRYPAKGPRWRGSLRRLNEARNGIAHDDTGRLRAVAVAGWPLTLSSVRRWRTALDGLAGAMDDVVGAYLQRLHGTAPW